MKTRKILALILALVMVLGLFAGCGAKEETAAPAEKEESAAPAEKEEAPATSESGRGSGDVYKIGLDCPMTGNCAGFGEQMSLGAQMAVDQINEAGGVNGKKLELVVMDDKADPKEAATITTKFVDDNDIVGIIGYYTSASCLAALPIINEAGVVTICTGSNPAISEANQQYGFRVEPADTMQAVYAGNWMVEDGRQKVAILCESTDYGFGQEELITQVIEEAGGEVVCSEAYIQGETKDFTNLLTKVKNSGADSVFIAGVYTEGALIAKQQQTLGMNLPLYSSSSMFEVPFLEAAGDAANGTKVQGVLVPDDPNPTIQAFQQEYKSRFGEDKVGGTFTGHAYASVYMLRDALENVGSADQAAMADYIASTTFDAVYGTVHFNETHDLMFESLARLVVEDGQFVVVPQE